MRKLNAKRITGFVAKFLVAAVVLAFLGLHSLNFFTYVFPSEQWYYAYLGFGLTGGGFIAYLLVFLWEADTHLQKWITLAISGVSGLGEILTAVFGMQVEAWKKASFALTESNFNSMLMAVGLLALAHAAALVGYLAGDKIIEFFGDDDGGGGNRPVRREEDESRKNGQFPVWQMDGFLSELNLTREKAQEIVANTADHNAGYQALLKYGLGDVSISKGNFNNLYYQLKPRKVTNP